MPRTGRPAHFGRGCQVVPYTIWIDLSHYILQLVSERQSTKPTTYYSVSRGWETYEQGPYESTRK
jgi:hypothetical protein